MVEGTGQMVEGTGQILPGRRLNTTLLLYVVYIALRHAFPANQSRGSGVLPLHL
jgi:hypothetical protein